MKKSGLMLIFCLLLALSACAQQDSENIIKSETNMETVEELPRDIELGTYYEEESGINLTPIRWKVLVESNGYVLLLSEKIIDAKPFHSTRTDTDWEKSTIRKWLNDDFYHVAFRESEQQNMKVGTALDDLVFLLSNEEVTQYLAEESTRTALPTPFAIKKGVYLNNVGECAWWLRSPVDDKTQTSYISSFGTFGNRPHYVDEHIIGARPAIWIKYSYVSGTQSK